MEKFITNNIEINAPKEAVWAALTEPEKTKIYMFGCETVSTWQPGAELLWRGNYEGKEMVFVKGNIVNIEPNQKLSYTVFDPLGTIEDIPENYLTVTYELQEAAGKTLLTVTQGDYTTVAEGEKRYTESYNNGEGWQPILVEIKKLVENS